MPINCVHHPQKHLGSSSTIDSLIWDAQWSALSPPSAGIVFVSCHVDSFFSVCSVIQSEFHWSAKCSSIRFCICLRKSNPTIKWISFLAAPNTFGVVDGKVLLGSYFGDLSSEVKLLVAGLHRTDFLGDYRGGLWVFLFANSTRNLTKRIVSSDQISHSF